MAWARYPRGPLTAMRTTAMLPWTLGIALARDLIALLGGSISAVSEPGEGNCFTLSLSVS